MAGNQEEDLKRAIKDGKPADEVQRLYNKYYANMVEGKQKPKSLSYFTG